MNVSPLHEAATAGQLVHSDILVYVALVGVLLGFGFAGFVILRTADGTDLEARKVRFAAATFTGILLLLILALTMSYVDTARDALLEKVLSSLTPLAGAILGYFFGRGKE